MPTQDKITMPSYGAGGVRIEGLTTDEVEDFQAMMLGECFLRKKKRGRLERKEAGTTFPDPKIDPFIAESWQTEEHPQKPPKKFEYGPIKHHFPSIIIQHLCGYGYTEKRYKQTAATLEDYGFACLRSRNGRDGKHWEVWFLPGLFMAEGELKVAIHGKKTDETKMKAALEILGRNVSFGTLDVCVQRMAMVID